jgi:predicted transcriptional regulator
MKIQDLLPPPVFQSIQSHLRTKSKQGEGAWECADQEEDSITGHFCGQLYTPRWIKDNAGGEDWEFRVTYKKFRSKGKDAEEKILGADGIVEVHIEKKSLEEKHVKGLLFQAKKSNDTRGKKLEEQAEKMARVVKNASCIFEYGKEFYAYDASLIAKRASKKDIRESKNPIGDFLADTYLTCEIGKIGMSYDAVAKEIIYPENGSIIRRKACLDYRLRIEARSK